MVRSYEKEVVSRIKSLKPWFDVKEEGFVKYGSLERSIYSILVRSRNSPSKNVFLSAGIHGDEPAGIYALLSFLDDHSEKYEDRMSFFAIPCLNPFGFENDTRENPNSMDLNRNFGSRTQEQETRIVKRVLEDHARTYIFSLDLHEDPVDKPAPGFELKDSVRKFYMYEISPSKECCIGHKVIGRLEQQGIPIAKQEKIYHDFNNNGLVWRQSPENKWNDKPSELFAYLQRYTDYSFTIETPTCWTLEKRIDVQIRALEIILKKLGNKS
jgi:Succinylglutamate desuccinylase / Aspartoacylase family